MIGYGSPIYRRVSTTINTADSEGFVIMMIKEKALRFLRSKNKSLLLSNLYTEIRVKLFRKFRPSSYPFISGDTFRAFAHVKLDEITGRSMSKAGKKLRRLLTVPRCNVNLFIDLHCTLEDVSREEILNWLQTFELSQSQKFSIILHNHDIVPPRDFFSAIERLSIRCYCPNVTDKDLSFVPIPLGIENRYFQKNGIVRHFPKVRESVLSSTEERPIGVFASFNIQTNRIERQESADSVMRFGHEFNQSRIRPCDFRRMLAASLFVMSPPGNGIDCHRTWEAIYFGAIPVIKREKLAESIYNDLPIYVVDDWSEICSLSRSQLEDLYNVVIKKSADKAYFEYWKNVISK
jgi:hypothetical protein